MSIIWIDDGIPHVPSTFEEVSATIELITPLFIGAFLIYMISFFAKGADNEDAETMSYQSELFAGDKIDNLVFADDTIKSLGVIGEVN